MPKKLTSQDREILDYADELMGQSRHQEFYTLASELLKHKDTSWDFAYSMVFRAFVQRDKALEDGDTKTAYKLNKLDDYLHLNADIVDENGNFFMGVDHYDFRDVLYSKLLEQGDHKAAAWYFQKDWCVVLSDTLEDGIQAKGEQWFDAYEWLGKFSECALKQQDFSDARQYARALMMLHEHHRFMSDKSPQHTNGQPISKRKGFDEAIRGYEQIADVALDNNNKDMALGVLGDIQELYNSASGRPKDWLNKKDRKYCRHISKRVEAVQGGKKTVAVVFEEIKGNFSVQTSTDTYKNNCTPV